MHYSKPNTTVLSRLCCIGLMLAICACSSTPNKTTNNSSTTKTVPKIAVDDETQHKFDSALSLMAANKLADAEALLKNITEATPTLPGAWVNLGIIYAHTERSTQAANVWERAIGLEPSGTEPYILLAQLRRQEGKFSDTEKLLQAALARWPDDADANYNLGILYDLYLDQPQKAIDSYGRYQAKQKEPDKTVAAWIEQLKVKTKQKEQ